MDFGRVSFGRRANRRFQYRPRYYDPDKEDLDIRVSRAHMESTGEYNPEGFENRIRQGFQQRSTLYTSEYNVIRQGARIRTILIILALGLVFYLTFYTNAFGVIFEAFYNV
ncbi:MAG: hypothetical protein H6608_09115 [Flavobacteriales bacterium]|nr:hypothetical protein [Bacteroidota bacterium]MCB9241280.1 hypothetical protein [Flavobacteriales bacterium]